MTQKEYNEKTDILKQEIDNLKKELTIEKTKTYNYEEVLEKYYIINEQLRQEKEFNKQNCLMIERLQKTIEQYEKMLDKFTIQYN